MKVIDSGPKFTRDDEIIILKPLTSFRQAPMDKCNISNLRKITKAINAKIFVTNDKDDKTSFVLQIPVVVEMKTPVVVEMKTPEEAVETKTHEEAVETKIPAAVET